MSRNIATRGNLRGAGSIDRATDSIVDSNLAVLHSYPVADIAGIQFSLTTYEDMLRNSIVTITDQAKNPSGVERYTPHDPSLGVVRTKLPCAGCGMDASGCGGHFGLIELHTYLAPPEKELQSTLKSLCGMICAGCGRLVLEDDILVPIRKGLESQKEDMQPADWHDLLIDTIYERSKGMSCHAAKIKEDHRNDVSIPLEPKTEAFQRAATIQGTTGKSKSDRSVFYPLEFYYGALERLTMKQLYLLGFAERTSVFNMESQQEEIQYVLNVHPKALIQRAIPVTPLCSRAPMVNESSTVFHPHTKAYNKIASLSSLVKAAKDRLRANSTLDPYGKMIPRVASDVWDKWKSEYEDQVSQLYLAHNEMYESQYKGILSNKKVGLVRNEGQGKVVMYIGRGPVVPDPRNPPGVFSIPRKAAAKMTIPVVVTAANISELTQLLRTGQVKYIYPHTAIIVGTNVQVTAANRPHLSIQIGDTVARDLQDGDPLLLIRQPALAGLSSIAGLVRLWDKEAIGVSPTETEIRAMDFDGDEGNILAPQSDDAISELKSIMAVDQLLINSKDQRIVFGAIQDSILGANIATTNPLTAEGEITEDRGWVTRALFDKITGLVSATAQGEISREGQRLGLKTKLEDFQRRLAVHGKIFSRLRDDGTEVVPSDVLISWAFPPDIYYTRRSVSIQDGIIIRGIVGKEVIGSAQDTYAHEVARTSRPRAITMITDAAIISTSFLSHHGMSGGWSDCAPIRDAAQREIGEILADMYTEIESISPAIDSIDVRRYQSELENAVQKASGKVDILVHNGIDPNNRLMKIISSGTKGAVRNIYNIVGVLGQQYAAGKLPSKMLSGGTRHTSYFDVDDREPTGMGMCTSSLGDGITPAEAIFVAAAARMSFINLNVSTPTIGKTSNEMYRVLQSVKSNAAGGCVDGDTLVSALYGGDGLAPQRLSRVRQPNGSLAVRFTDLESFTDSLNAEQGWYRK